MRIVKTAKFLFESFLKTSGEVFDNIQEPLQEYFLRNLTLDDNRIEQALREENYEEAASIRDGYFDEAKNISMCMSEDIEMEIDKLGVPYRFEEIQASGIAINDYCVIANRVLKYSPDNMMFVIFHELAHHYQYRKYGPDFAESIYTNDIDQLDDDIDKLVMIESTANKFASMKTNFYIKKYDLNVPLASTMGGSDKGFLKRHVLHMKQMVMKMPPEKRNIYDINEALYNLIKVNK